ncbi:hypothetical protein J28TS4_12960 [Paenibacillus lautus]|nr:hypothetical protein J28TS4_12960 [Paenibacillus lautus]
MFKISQDVIVSVVFSGYDEPIAVDASFPPSFGFASGVFSLLPDEQPASSKLVNNTAVNPDFKFLSKLSLASIRCTIIIPPILG